MQRRQRVIGHHGKHVMFNVVVHVPVYEAQYGVHVNRAAIEAVVQNIFGKSTMLSDTRHHMHPSAIHGGQRPDEQHWENGTYIY